jgi:CDP-paratose 2-epimerase
MDYARIYGLRTVCLRQSCIYGPRQFGVEDQGWVAWFTIAATLGRRITIYGDGKQIRDVLHVNDLIACYEAAIEKADEVAGQAFNIGGGAANTLSLLELLELLRRETGLAVPVDRGEWRPGDQKVFVCSIRKAEHLLGWEPKVNAAAGVKSLVGWVQENQELLREMF